MGAAFYDDEGCIDCGMCAAKTEEEMVAASRKIRAYLRSNVLSSGTIKKIAVAGKGGVGKSTIVTLIANTLREQGYNILVLDTDESNPGLFRLLGFEKEPKPLISLLNRFSPGESENSTWLKPEKIAIGDIPPDYIVSRDGLKFLMVGKIEDPFQGCACAMADINRELMEKLVMNDNDVVLADLEAGVESFGRGVERSIDTLLVIVEPSFESLALAGKIGYMAEGMGISRVRAILNKVPSEKVRQKMIEELAKNNISCLGTVYFDTQLNEAGFEGKIITDSKATGDIKAIIKVLLGVV
jgi:CO dehydrogenase maturation factor